jgi:glutamyl-tRNA reductase
MVRNAMKIRKNRPLLFLDLAVPRDVEPQVAKLPNVFVHDLDALGGLVAQSLAHRRAEVPKVEAIIDSEMARFLRWHRSLALKPTVTAFRSHFEEIAKEELDRHRGRFRPEDHAALEALVHGIVQKLLHRPTTRLNRADGEGDGIARIDAVRDLFGIDQEDPGADRDTR